MSDKRWDTDIETTPAAPWDLWNDYAGCWTCRSCDAAAGFGVHNRGCPADRITAEHPMFVTAVKLGEAKRLIEVALESAKGGTTSTAGYTHSAINLLSDAMNEMVKIARKEK